MGRGFSLTEMLIVIMTIPRIGLVVDRAFRDWAIDVPRGVTLVLRHERLQGVVEDIRDDIDQAMSLYLEDSPQAEGPPVLVIEQSGRQIRYAQLEEGIRREARGDDLDPNVPADWEWLPPPANTERPPWRPRDAGGGLRRTRRRYGPFRLVGRPASDSSRRDLQRQPDDDGRRRGHHEPADPAGPSAAPPPAPGAARRVTREPRR